jgi:uncharacterized Ntn-hydrolase superfamily protein
MTFTMVARCPNTQALGVVTCTCGLAIGSAVPHAEKNVGAIATQHSTNILHGTNGLRLLKLGFEPKRAMKSTLALDPNPEIRQVLIVDSAGRTSAHTGSKNSPWCGDIEGDGYVVAGNIVKGPEVLESMAKTFESLREKPLHKRLVEAIDAGLEAGGCIRPDTTTALLVVGIEEELKLSHRPNLDLRVDYSEQPTKKLRELYEIYIDWVKESKKRAQETKKL